MANTFFYNTGKVFAKHMMPVLLDCNFVVDSANGNGLGIRSLKGPGILNVFMHTSASPATGNPNPAAGYIYVQLQDPYNRDYGGFDGQVSPVTGGAISISGAAVMTIGVPYVITSVGTSTQANWQAVGLPLGIVPAVGVPFIATAAGLGTGTGQVHAVGVSGIIKIEGIGNSSLSVASNAQGMGGLPAVGGYFLFQCLGATDASTTTMIPTAPADGSVISLKFYMSNSSVTVAGE